jgi:hypothetical protein
MAELTQSGSRWERTLASLSGRSLLVAFWMAFIVSALATALPVPASGVFAAVGQFVLAIIWLGYPIGLFHCFAARKVRIVGVPVMTCGVLIGYVLSVFVYDKGGELARSTVAPLLGAAFIFAPFIAGAHALKEGEKRAKLSHTANVVLTAFALFAFPFFGAYVHERFRRAFFSLRGLSP